MINKIASLLAVTCVVVLFVASSADAQLTTTVVPSPHVQTPQPVIAAQAAVTAAQAAAAAALRAASNLSGTITVPASVLAAPNASFTCGNIMVYASSKEMTTCAPLDTTFCSPQPAWTAHVQATGAIASGSCSYLLSVPSSFPIAVSAHTNYVLPGQCGFNRLTTSGIGAYVSTSSSPRAPRLTQNFTLKAIAYIDCPH